METKDYFYIIGLAITSGFSLISLAIAIKNRRNSIREHLYKEQMNYFLKLSKELHLVLELFYDVARLEKIDDATDNKIEQRLDEIYLLSESNDFITPDQIIHGIDDVIRKGDELHLLTLKQKKISKDDILSFQNSYFDLTEDIRELLGVDKLSEENRKLYHRSALKRL